MTTENKYKILLAEANAVVSINPDQLFGGPIRTFFISILSPGMGHLVSKIATLSETINLIEGDTIDVK